MTKTRKLRLLCKAYLPVIRDVVIIALSITAVYISLSSYNESKHQFQKSSESVQVMYDSLLEKSEDQNIKIVNELLIQHQITKNQLAISKSHLEFQIDRYNEIILSERPKLSTEINEDFGSKVISWQKL